MSIAKILGSGVDQGRQIGLNRGRPTEGQKDSNDGEMTTNRSMGPTEEYSFPLSPAPTTQRWPKARTRPTPPPSMTSRPSPSMTKCREPKGNGCALHLRSSDAGSFLHHRASRRQEDTRASPQNRKRSGPSAATPRRSPIRSFRLLSHVSPAIGRSGESASVRPLEAPKRAFRPNIRASVVSWPRSPSPW